MHWAVNCLVCKASMLVMLAESNNGVALQSAFVWCLSFTRRAYGLENTTHEKQQTANWQIWLKAQCVLCILESVLCVSLFVSQEA